MKLQNYKILIFLFIFFISCSNSKDNISKFEYERGDALIDRIIYEVRTDITIAIKDNSVTKMISSNLSSKKRIIFNFSHPIFKKIR